jgi:MFS family permease
VTAGVHARDLAGRKNSRQIAVRAMPSGLRRLPSSGSAMTRRTHSGAASRADRRSNRVLQEGNRLVTTDTTSPPHFTGRQRLILLLLLGAGFMVSADFSILNVALPKVGAGVGLGLTGLPWISSAYALPAAGFTLLFGRMADLFGRRRLFLSGMVLLIGASLLGGFAANPEMLLTARALQGFATAMTTPAAMSLLTSNFAEGAVRNRVLGLNGALLSGGFTVGALVGGTLVSLVSWQAAFFINIPVAVAILLLTPLLISESSLPDRMKLDLPGAVTVTGGLLAVIYAVIEKNIPSAAVGVLLLAAFWLIELRSSAPLAPLRILKRPTVRWGNYAGLVVFTMETAMIFLMTLYLQNVLGLSPLTTGLIFGVPGLAAMAAGVIAGRLIGRHGSRKILAAGLSVQSLATLPLVFLGTDRAALAVLIPALFIGFFGHVTCIVAYTVTGTSGLANHEQGLATGLTSMTQQVAIAIGIPILTSVAATQRVELTGIRLALSVDVAVTLISVVFIWYGLRPRGERHTATAAMPVPEDTDEQLAASLD